MKDWGKSVQVAATYIGTVVGAGFASGQEIFSFFTSQGHQGTIGILLAMGCFIWLGYKMMMAACIHKTPSYESFNLLLFGPVLGRIMNIVVLITLLGVTTVMLAGAGAVFEEQIGIPSWLGISLSVAMGYAVLKKGLDRILAVNAIVVPMMLLFTVLIFISAGPDILPSWQIFDLSVMPVWKALLYVSFNLAMAQSVLIPMGYQIRNPSVFRKGAVLGGLGLGVMLLGSHVAMLPHVSEVRLLEIPIAYITREWNDVFHALFLVVLYAEIFTTMISNIYGVSQQFMEIHPMREQTYHIVIFIVCLGFGFIGFSKLLLYIYPLFGYLGMATILRLSFHKNAEK